MSEPPDRPRGSIFSSFTIGSVLQALTLTVALIGWAVSSHNTAEEAAHDVARLDASVGDKLAELRAALSSGLQDIRGQISALPDTRAQVAELQRHGADLDLRLTAQDVRLRALEKASIEQGAALVHINQPLGRTQR